MLVVHFLIASRLRRVKRYKLRQVMSDSEHTESLIWFPLLLNSTRKVCSRHKQNIHIVLPEMAPDMNGIISGTIRAKELRLPLVFTISARFPHHMDRICTFHIVDQKRHIYLWCQKCVYEGLRSNIVMIATKCS